MSVEIRPITERDYDDWKPLWDKYLIFYKTDLSDEIAESNFKRFLDPEVKMWSALAIDPASGKPIGMVNYFTHVHTWDTKDRLLLNDLYVDEESRLKGTGRKLIEYVFKQGDEMGCPDVYWNTQFENHRAQLLYTKVGKKAGSLSYNRAM